MIYLLFGIFSAGAVFAEVNLQKNCDIVGQDLLHVSVPSPELCQQKCIGTAGCQGFSFISNWNKCFLKKNVKRVVEVKMISGRIEISEGKRIMQRQEYVDNKGKDWKKISAPSADKCESHCIAENTCLGFTFIDGYDTCWLKNTPGSLVSKVFFCGVLP